MNDVRKGIVTLVIMIYAIFLQGHLEFQSDRNKIKYPGDGVAEFLTDRRT